MTTIADLPSELDDVLDRGREMTHYGLAGSTWIIVVGTRDGTERA